MSKCVIKLFYIYAMKYCSAIKRNKVPSHTNRWMVFKYILLKERSQSEKTIYIYCQLCDSLIWQKYRNNKQISGFHGLVVEREKWITKIQGVGIWGRPSFQKDTVMMDTWSYVFLRTHRTSSTKSEVLYMQILRNQFKWYQRTLQIECIVGHNDLNVWNNLTNEMIRKLLTEVTLETCGVSKTKGKRNSMEAFYPNWQNCFTMQNWLTVLMIFYMYTVLWALCSPAFCIHPR